MKKILSLLACLPLALAAHAQSSKMVNPDVLGVTLQTKIDDAIPLLKKKYPKLSYTTSRREVTLNEGSLFYNAIYDVTLEANPNGSPIAQDKLLLSVLPDGSLLGMKRTVLFKQQKQSVTDIFTSLTEKYGTPVLHYPGTNSETAEMQWSDTMPPGLVLVGMDYQQAGAVYTTNLGITPYPACRDETMRYTDDSFDPVKVYRLTFHHPVWKKCGTVADVLVFQDDRINLYARRMEFRLVNVTAAADLMARLPQMVDKHPDTKRLIPATIAPVKSAPAF